VKKKELTVEELACRFSALRKLGVIGKEPQTVSELKDGTIKRGVAYPLDRSPVRLEGAKVLTGGNGTSITVFGYDGKTVEETLGGNIFVEGVTMR